MDASGPGSMSDEVGVMVLLGAGDTGVRRELRCARGIWKWLVGLDDRKRGT